MTWSARGEGGEEGGEGKSTITPRQKHWLLPTPHRKPHRETATSGREEDPTPTETSPPPPPHHPPPSAGKQEHHQVEETTASTPSGAGGCPSTQRLPDRGQEQRHNDRHRQDPRRQGEGRSSSRLPARSRRQRGFLPSRGEGRGEGEARPRRGGWRPLMLRRWPRGAAKRAGLRLCLLRRES